ncbi:TetR family transcriptional regulator [Amycolatopsis regifaucium]|uniref:TetR family transcriptional regulator n=1 Tax=Amycolatopsis regifaucium TaxID=546365 RepID=A0A154MPC6_9PSEU|nr:TetR family transcriptional regulator [Amycolatopsis regifaucium]KZB85707.1 TetR family transcriptional regulator [Amycolatopsis regifaucium]OKA10538.1 TetR family transcriptional regulator [Amycolatopsis regifaucium]SFI81298.1 DNA-binding transcriptional regulator, AcrR family [Amycolatopsis regifaucium]
MAAEDTTVRRRGRRPGGQDTRTALIEAARAVFGESGFDGATVRAIATRAGVDAAMVNHWFGSKEGLFAQAVLKLPFDPHELLAELKNGPDDEFGSRIVRAFLTRWDGAGGEVFQALVRSVAGHEQAALVLRSFFQSFFTKIIGEIGSDRVELRTSLCASQLVGMGLVRYVAKFEPMATSEIEPLVTAIAPTVQRYLTGNID